MGSGLGRADLTKLLQILLTVFTAQTLSPTIYTKKMAIFILFCSTSEVCLLGACKTRLANRYTEPTKNRGRRGMEEACLVVFLTIEKNSFFLIQATPLRTILWQHVSIICSVCEAEPIWQRGCTHNTRTKAAVSIATKPQQNASGQLFTLLPIIGQHCMNQLTPSVCLKHSCMQHIPSAFLQAVKIFSYEKTREHLVFQAPFPKRRRKQEIKKADNPLCIWAFPQQLGYFKTVRVPKLGIVYSTDMQSHSQFLPRR